jgi:hypothetical protein
MRRRIKKANIRFLSLVPKGANQIAPVYKDDGSVTLHSLIKIGEDFDEKGELLAVVYAPEMRDSQGDIASAEVIKDAAYGFIANGAKVDIRHDEKALKPEQARVAETFIVQKGDQRFAGWKDYSGSPVDLTGSWATIIKIEDPDLRAKYRKGEWQGVSMGGTAVVEQEKADDSLLEKLLKALNAQIPQPTKKTMDEEKILKALEKGFTALGEVIAKAVTPPKPEQKPEQKAEQKAEPKAEEQAPAFVGKADDERALIKHERKLALFHLKKATDWSDPKSIRAYREQVAVLKEEWAAEDEEAGVDIEAEAEAEQRKSVRKAGSAQSGRTQNSNLFDAQVADGLAAAKRLNKGYADIGNSKED